LGREQAKRVVSIVNCWDRRREEESRVNAKYVGYNGTPVSWRVESREERREI
jgi:hypothetical protein